MKSRTTWQWNPVRGEYQAGDPVPLQGTGEISAIGAFANKTMLLLGSTGFVGTDTFPGGGGGGDVVVPEPTSLALSGIGCLALLSMWGVRRWRAVAA